MRQYEISRHVPRVQPRASGFHKQNHTKSHMQTQQFVNSNGIRHNFPWLNHQATRAPPRKNVSDGGRAKRPRRSDTPEVSLGSSGSPSDALDFGAKLFLTLPEWNITELDIKMIRERGLVPDNLRLNRSRSKNQWKYDSDFPKGGGCLEIGTDDFTQGLWIGFCTLCENISSTMLGPSRRHLVTVKNRLLILLGNVEVDIRHVPSRKNIEIWASYELTIFIGLAHGHGQSGV